MEKKALGIVLITLLVALIFGPLLTKYITAQAPGEEDECQRCLDDCQRECIDELTRSCIEEKLSQWGTFENCVENCKTSGKKGCPQGCQQECQVIEDPDNRTLCIDQCIDLCEAYYERGEGYEFCKKYCSEAFDAYKKAAFMYCEEKREQFAEQCREQCAEKCCEVCAGVYSSGVTVTNPDGTTISPYMGMPDIAEETTFTFTKPNGYFVLPDAVIRSETTEATATVTKLERGEAESTIEVEIANFDPEKTVEYIKPVSTLENLVGRIRYGMYKIKTRFAETGPGRYICEHKIELLGSTAIYLMTNIPTSLLTVPTKLLSRAIGTQYEMMRWSEEERKRTEIYYPLPTIAVMDHEGRPGTLVIPFWCDFLIETLADGTTTVHVFEGTVELSDAKGKTTVYVAEGYTSTCKPGGVPSAPVLFDPDAIDKWWEAEFEVPALAAYVMGRGEGEHLRPTEETKAFLTSDEEARLWLHFTNVHRSHEVTADWYDPDGEYYSTTTSTIEQPPQGNYYENYHVLLHMPIKDEEAAEKLGTWNVEVYLDDEQLFSTTFEIKSAREGEGWEALLGLLFLVILIGTPLYLLKRWKSKKEKKKLEGTQEQKRNGGKLIKVEVKK